MALPPIPSPAPQHRGGPQAQLGGLAPAKVATGVGEPGARVPGVLEAPPHEGGAPRRLIPAPCTKALEVLDDPGVGGRAGNFVYPLLKLTESDLQPSRKAHLSSPPERYGSCTSGST